MRITITGVNFRYENGYDQDYTGVQLSYISSGFQFSPNGEPISITKEEYETNRQSKDGLKFLVADKILSDADEFITNLTTYKNSLKQAE
ncbi:hypothetical protein ACFQ4N_09330 [Oceanobacillus iheyensis]|uniref:hypothetical protein n=1 Tax=Oceanobacillus iheyensis TaxID=182710 RepID=UPI0036430003